MLRACIQQKGRRRLNLLSVDLGHPPSPGLDIGAPGSQNFGFRLNYTTGFLGSPACSQLAPVTMEALKSWGAQEKENQQTIQTNRISVSISICFSGAH